MVTDIARFQGRSEFASSPVHVFGFSGRMQHYARRAQFLALGCPPYFRVGVLAFNAFTIKKIILVYAV